MELQTTRYQTDGDLVRLTLDRPDVLNAVNYQGTLELHQAAQAIHNDPHARAVLIRRNQMVGNRLKKFYLLSGQVLVDDRR